MAEISVDFRNSVGSKKCAVSSPRIVSLEIGHESPDTARKFAFHGYILNEPVSVNDVKCERNLICGCDEQSDKNLNNSRSSLSTSTCNERPSDKIKLNNDIDIDLLDLLNSTKLKEASKSCEKNFNFKTITSNEKMKISSSEVSDDLSDLLSSISQEISKKEEVNATSKRCQGKNTQECGIDVLEFDFSKNECIENSYLCNNSSLKVEGNLSELLSAVNIENSNVSKVENRNPSSLCPSINAQKFSSEETPPVVDLSDLLSSIDLELSKDKKVGSYNGNNKCNTKVTEIKNEACLSDLLLSIDIDKSNAATLKEEPCADDLCDLLSSIDNSNSCNSKFHFDNQVNVSVMGANKESCIADLLSSVEIDKSNHRASTLLNNKPLYCGNSNLCFKGNNGESDSLNDFDLSCSSSNSSCTSSCSETENISPKRSLTKHELLTNKVLECDSDYSSLDSAQREFSFFDYSSENPFSFNSLLTKKLDVDIATKDDCEEAKNPNEEMSMSDLLTIVSPDFKNPVLATLNNADKLDNSLNEDSSSMLDLIKSLNIKSQDFNPNVINNKCDDKLIGYDCIDGQISKKVQTDSSTILQADDSKVNEDKLVAKSDILNNDEITSDDEQDFFIDLRECVKSVKHQPMPTSPIRQVKSNETLNSNCFSPNKILFDCEKKSSLNLSQKSSNLFEFRDAAPMKRVRVNTKQTLFSKALACKPKNDSSLLQEVANIKKELLNSIIHRPVFIDCEVPKPIVESVMQSDRCIISSVGRRSFGLDVSFELQ